ncbi:MAG: isoprenoid biosynthesis glyoxalase ElbB [Bacteriovoracaceae bacterium]|nr:isoprenoid biosynthesis glyoxalase ElbB [Bacteriovoracaceae bacterium]
MSNSPKFAIILSGCGVYDGSEIHETVTTMLAIDQQGATYDCFAPDIDQHHVINHIDGQVIDQKRNVLVESARIARGKIQPLSTFQASQYNCLILPGGFGAAKNLSSYAFEQGNLNVHKDVANAIMLMKEQGKPIGALCIAPVILAKLLPGIALTIGQDKDTASVVETLGANHQNTNNGEIVVDKDNKVVTSPCYMLEASIKDVALGAYNTVKELIALM